MNAKALLIYGLLSSVLIFCYSCGECSKKIDCPGYQDDVLDRFFPYQDNQQLIFLSSTNEQQTLTLKNMETSEPYQAVGRPYGGTPICRATKRFAAAETDTSGRTLFGITLEKEGNHFRSADFAIGRNWIRFQLFSDTGIARIDINGFSTPVKTQHNIIVGNRTFNKAIVAGRDTVGLKQPGIYQIYYTEAEGLVGYKEYPSLKTWVKQ